MATIPVPSNPGFPEVYQLELEDDVIGGPNGTSNRQAKNLAERDAFLKKVVEQEIADRDGAANNLQSQINANTEGIEANADAINAMKGRGGYLMAHDFGKDQPTQAELNAYALTQIDVQDPAAIWNGTHVKNLYNSHVWVLTNTPNTEPAIFEWIDDGFDSVSVADNEGTLGVVRGSLEEGYASVEPATGKIKLVLPTGLAAANAMPIIARHNPCIVASGKRQITIRRGTYIPLETTGADRWLKADENIVLNVEDILGSALLPGKPYTVFLVPTADGLDIKIDQADVPDGYTQDQVRAIAGFDTLCVDVGNGLSYTFGGLSYDHPLNGYSAGDILPQSIWSLNHRPFSNPKGMVYIPTLDFWSDIYLQSGSGPNTKSVYQGAITRNRQYVDFVEDQFCVNKALLNDEEFAAAMLGSNEKTTVAGSSEAGATNGGAGGRKDTAGRRMISIYGCEEGCGSLWQWLSSTSAAGSSGWTAQAGGKGDFYGACYVLRAGGYWSNSAYCGSRARTASYSRAGSTTYIGGRGRSRAQNFLAY